MLTITPATEADAPLVYEIMQTAFEEYRQTLFPPSSAHAETVEDALAMMREGGAILAWLDGQAKRQAVGSARYAFRRDDEGVTYCYVGRVSVLPEQRGKGIASAMMQHLETLARQRQVAYVQVSVRTVLESNVKLYQRLGYAITGTVVHPRGDGTQQFVMMAKSL